jgi:hypothetical protein
LLRLASLLWRLRRATAIDTGLLETPTELDTVLDLEGTLAANERAAAGVVQIGSLENPPSLEGNDEAQMTHSILQLQDGSFSSTAKPLGASVAMKQRVMAASVPGDLCSQCGTTTKPRPELASPIIIKPTFSSIEVVFAKTLKPPHRDRIMAMPNFVADLAVASSRVAGYRSQLSLLSSPQRANLFPRRRATG